MCYTTEKAYSVLNALYPHFEASATLHVRFLHLSAATAAAHGVSYPSHPYWHHVQHHYCCWLPHMWIIDSRKAYRLRQGKQVVQIHQFIYSTQTC